MTKANWKEWKHTPQVLAWQACALSLDIDPNSMEASKHSWMGGFGAGLHFEPNSFPDEDAKIEFELRQRVLLANLVPRGRFSWFTKDLGTPNMSEVRMSEFAAWAVSDVGWDDLPPELVAMASDKHAAAAPPKDEAPLALHPQRAAEGITKEQVLIAFESLVSQIDLKKALGNGTGLFGEQGARTQKGTRGGKHEALWDPVVLAFGLNEKYSVPMPHLKKAFNDHLFLRKWSQNWNDKLDLLGE